MSRREVKERLSRQGATTDLARVLSGRLDLKVRHVIEINRALGIHPMEFFRIVFKEPAEPSPLQQKLRDLLGPGASDFREVPAQHHEPAPADAGARPAPSESPGGELETIRQRLAWLTREVERLKAAIEQPE
jgi:hypothetical protein